MNTGDLVRFYDPYCGHMLGLILSVHNPYPRTPGYMWCEILWNKDIPQWMRGCGKIGRCSAEILLMVK